MVPMIIFALAVFFLYSPPFMNLGDAISMEIFLNSFSTFLLWFLPSTSMVWFLTFELLYQMKIKKPFMFHAKRVVGRFILSLFGTSLLVGITDVLFIILSPFLSLRIILPSSLLVATLVFGIVIWRFRGFFVKLDKGW